MNASADINGDKKPDKILLKEFKDKEGLDYFRLSVNNQIIYDRLPGVGKVSGFLLADIDRKDKFKEIIVVATGFQSSDWSGNSIYWFNGKTIHRVTRAPLMWLRFPGDGQVLHEEMINPIVVSVPYDLQPDHTLKRRTQKYYEVAVNETVKASFPIYARPGLQKIAVLRAGTKVRISKSDLGNWLYLRAGRRTYGWMNTRWNSGYEAFGIAAAG